RLGRATHKHIFGNGLEPGQPCVAGKVHALQPGCVALQRMKRIRGLIGWVNRNFACPIESSGAKIPDRCWAAILAEYPGWNRSPCFAPWCQAGEGGCVRARETNFPKAKSGLPLRPLFCFRPCAAETKPGEGVRGVGKRSSPKSSPTSPCAHRFVSAR